MSIRLTKQRRKQIINKARSLYEPRIAKKRNELRPDFYDDLVQTFYDQHMQPIEALVLHDEWFKEYKSVDVHWNNDNYSYAKPLTKTYKILCLELFNSGNQLKIFDDYIPAAFEVEYDKYYSAILKIEKEQTEFVNHLTKVLNNCNTLSQFLKIWPQAEHLIADITFDESTKKRRTTTKVEIDEETVSNLNAGLLKQTMLNK